jgi:hypothetical protein
MYNKLFTKILDSSIWLQPTPTRIVWLTFIAAMDEHGFAQFASIANVARRAIVSVEEAEAAITHLEGPDPDSSDQDNEGRRLERVPGGWVVINAGKHRDMVTRAIIQEQTRLRVRRYRDKKKRTCNEEVTPSVSESEAVSEAVSEASSVPPLLPTKPLAYRHRIDVAWPGRPPVPGGLHAEFVSKLGGDPEDAYQKLHDWYPMAAKAWDNKPIGDDDWTFWRARFREWVGTTKVPTTRTSGNKAAVEQAIAALRQGRTRDER